MVDFIELTNADRRGNLPLLVRKSQVVAIQPYNALLEDCSSYVYLRSGEMFHVKQSYNSLIERFKFE